MKQKKNLASSLLVALLAGFIYYQLGGVEDIQKIASFGYQMMSNPVERITTNEVAVNGKLIEINNSIRETQPDLITSEENQLDSEQSMIELAVTDPISSFVSSIPDDLYKINMSDRKSVV